MKFKTTLLFSALASFAVGNLARADFDARPYISGNKIVTGGHDDEVDSDVAVERVFAYEFGEIMGLPYSAGDPGFNTDGPSNFTNNTALNYRALALSTGSFLRYWDGSGSPNFVPAPTGVTLALYRTPAAYVTYAPGSAAYAGPTPLPIGTFDATGSIHEHLDSEIFFNGAQADGTVPEGTYLLSFRLENPGTGVANSDPLYIVYNNGLTETQTDAAVAYVNATYVPEPGSLALLGGGAATLLRRRRSR